MTSTDAHASFAGELVGRANELEMLARLLRGESDPVLVLRGDPGVGKSALLNEAIAQAPEVQPVRAVGVESEMHLPLAGLHQIVYALEPSLGSLTDRERRLFEDVLSGTLSDPPVMGLGIALLNLWHETAAISPH